MFVTLVICDIGSAAFNCDMRRTHEILDVPKAWYKHDLMRRMFLGKEGTYATSMTREGKIVTSTYVAEDVLPANEMTAINPLINCKSIKKNYLLEFPNISFNSQVEMYHLFGTAICYGYCLAFTK